MRIDVSEPVLCGCDTCVQHRTLSNTQETEPSNVIGSSVASAPVSPGPVQPLGSTSNQSSGTETTPPLAPLPPVTTSVNPEQPSQSADPIVFKFPPLSSEPAQALAPTASGSTQAPALGFAAFATCAPSFVPWGSSRISFAPSVTSAAPVQALGTTTTTTPAAAASSSPSSPVHSSSPTTFLFPPAFTSPAAPSGPTQDSTFGSGASSTSSLFDAEQPSQSGDSIVFKFPPVSSELAQPLARTASGSTQAPAFGFGAFGARVQSAQSFVPSGSSRIGFAPPVTSAAPVQALGTTTTTTPAAAASSSTSSPVQSSSPTTFQFPPAFTSAAAPSGPTQASTFGSGASSTPSSFNAPSPVGWGSLQANGPTNTSPPPFSFLPAQGSDKTDPAFPPPFGYQPSGFARTVVGGGSCCGGNRFSSPSGRAPRNPFGSFLHPGFGPSNLSGPIGPPTIPVSGHSPFWGGLGTEQGSRFPPYAPTPVFDNPGGPAKQIISISASDSRGHKSHEELRWEDYKNGDKGGFGWFPPAAHTSPFSAPTVSPSLFAPPSIPDRPRLQQNMSGFPIGYNIPTAFQRPHQPAGVSSTASGCCTACGATSSSSPSGPLGFNFATNPPSAATSLPGLFLSASGSFPMMFATPNLAAYGTTATPGVQAYAIIFGTQNLAAQGITATPAVQAYPMMFGTPNLTAQGTTTGPAFQGTTTAPAFQAYPTMFGTPNLAGQGTTTPPAGQPYPTMFGVAQATTTPAVQPSANNAMMFGTPSLGAQGITPAGQAYPAHGLALLPFGAMSLQ